MINLKNFIERDPEIIALCRGKSVLHLGCVGFTDCSVSEKTRLARESLHAAITEVADQCLGVDLDGETVTQLTNGGVFNNLVEGNVEKLSELDLSPKVFDLVIAGDIIEHLSNPGLMLDGIQERLGSGGQLLVSTPNSFGIASWIRVLFGRFREGAQHVLCFNPITLEQLLNRHNLEVTSASTCYQTRAAQNYGKSFKVLRAILRKFPKFGGTLYYVCTPRKSDN